SARPRAMPVGSVSTARSGPTTKSWVKRATGSRSWSTRARVSNMLSLIAPTLVLLVLTGVGARAIMVTWKRAHRPPNVDWSERHDQQDLRLPAHGVRSGRPVRRRQGPREPHDRRHPVRSG